MTQLVLDKENKAANYFEYMRKLIREGFSGSVTVTFFEGGIRYLTKNGELLIPMKVKETVKMR